MAQKRCVFRQAVPHGSVRWCHFTRRKMGHRTKVAMASSHSLEPELEVSIPLTMTYNRSGCVLRASATSEAVFSLPPGPSSSQGDCCSSCVHDQDWRTGEGQACARLSSEVSKKSLSPKLPAGAPYVSLAKPGSQGAV